MISSVPDGVEDMSMQVQQAGDAVWADQDYAGIDTRIKNLA
jgi:hypothetical protein